jgi:hypothetical protein
VLAAFWRLVSDARPRLLGTVDHGKLSPIEISMAPAQRGNLATAHATQCGQDDRNMHPLWPRQLERGYRGCDIPDLHLPPLDLGRIAVLARVPRQHTPANRLLQRLAQHAMHVVHGSRREPGQCGAVGCAESAPVAGVIATGNFCSCRAS